jgi:hypothetical protein
MPRGRASTSKTVDLCHCRNHQLATTGNQGIAVDNTHVQSSTTQSQALVPYDHDQGNAQQEVTEVETHLYCRCRTFGQVRKIDLRCSAVKPKHILSTA